MTIDEPHAIPLPDIRRLIDIHGVRAVGLAFLRAALAGRRRARPPDAGYLNAHMRRDIGLPPGDGMRASRFDPSRHIRFR